ncbi:lac repressor [Raoultella terrigena]|uniref:Lac repressor n=1 Tax=Raoultella terrigena TaxID=577 RepID=A0A3P8M3P2_RAOTE|nr:lac repressor [Raoultella terrigena]
MRGEAFYQALTALGVDTRRDLQPLFASLEGYEGRAAGRRRRRRRAGGDFLPPTRSWPAAFLTACAQRGKEAPADFQLIGFDNTPQTAQYSYRLTTLHQDVAEISRQALTRLLERASDPLQPHAPPG